MNENSNKNPEESTWPLASVILQSDLCMRPDALRDFFGISLIDFDISQIRHWIMWIEGVKWYVNRQ